MGLAWAVKGREGKLGGRAARQGNCVTSFATRTTKLPRPALKCEQLPGILGRWFKPRHSSGLWGCDHGRLESLCLILLWGDALTWDQWLDHRIEAESDFVHAHGRQVFGGAQ